MTATKCIKRRPSWEFCHKNSLPPVFLAQGRNSFVLPGEAGARLPALQESPPASLTKPARTIEWYRQLRLESNSPAVLN